MGTLPAHGVFSRHIDGLTLQNITIETVNPDARPAVILDDVQHETLVNIKSGDVVLDPKKIVRR